jgi:hypothetical protein
VNRKPGMLVYVESSAHGLVSYDQSDLATAPPRVLARFTEGVARITANAAAAKAKAAANADPEGPAKSADRIKRAHERQRQNGGSFQKNLRDVREADGVPPLPTPRHK